jgi:hypothetical protein
MIDHGPNVRLRGMVHDAKARAGRTECGVRFVLYASVSEAWAIAKATETTDEVNCMACVAAEVL